MNITKNNVHVSGSVLEETVLSPNIIQVMVGIETNETILPITTLVEANQWSKFKEEFPERYNSVAISGLLQSSRANDGYIIKAGDHGVTCFNNILQGSLNETGSQFYGLVRLKKKFDFDTSSKLFLKRMIFETNTFHPVEFEAMALRSAAPYFDKIEEGDEMLLKANYVLDKNGNPPYWRIKHKPELAEEQLAT